MKPVPDQAASDVPGRLAKRVSGYRERLLDRAEWNDYRPRAAINRPTLGSSAGV